MNYLIIVLILGIAIGIHELGHYLALKKIGVYVHKFAIGFGPKLLSWKSKETEVSIRLLPLGGFVMPATTAEVEERIPLIDGITVGINDKVETVNNRQYLIRKAKPYFVEGRNVEDFPPRKRLRYLTAGVLFNIASGFIVFFIAVLIFNFDGWMVSPFINFFKLLWSTIQMSFNAIFIFIGFFIGLFTGNNLDMIGSPIGIVGGSNDILDPGGTGDWSTIALNTVSVYFSLSINLFVFNLLPIPPLDGYKITTTTIEMIKGKPINPKVDAKISSIAISLLLTFSAFLILRDLFRLF